MDEKEIERRFNALSDMISKANSRVNSLSERTVKIENAIRKIYRALMNIFKVT